MSKKLLYQLLAILMVASLALSACGTTNVQTQKVIVVVEQPAAAPVQDYSNPPAPSGGSADVVTAPSPMPTPTNAHAFAPITWDNTCKEQSKLVGVALKPLAEGSFFACVYNGVAASVTIPAGTLADLDLGGIYVAKGPVKVDGVPNLTLRPARTGTDSEACAQVDALTAYGQTLAKPFKAQPYNFSCN